MPAARRGEPDPAQGCERHGEGLVTYRQRRGCAVTELDLAELAELALRRCSSEEAAARRAHDRRDARRAREGGRVPERGRAGDVAGQLEANRRPRRAARPGSRPLDTVDRSLWDHGAYRVYYALPGEAEGSTGRTGRSWQRSLAAMPACAITLQDAHRERALERRAGVASQASPSSSRRRPARKRASSSSSPVQTPILPLSG